MGTTKTGFNFNQADKGFNLVIHFDSFAFHNVLFECKLCQKDPGTHVYTLTQNMEW